MSTGIATMGPAHGAGLPNHRGYGLSVMALALLGAMILPGSRPALALNVALELSPGVGIPLGAFPDGVPVTVADPSGDSLLQIPDSIYNLLVDGHTSAAFGLNAALLLDNFTLRVAFSYQQLSSVSFKRFAIVRANGTDTGEIVRNLYAWELAEERTEDLSDKPTILMSRFTLGYRWYLLDGRIRPYLPLGFGGALMVLSATGEPTESHFGLTAYAGLGAEYVISEHLDIGLLLQYEWIGIFLPDNFQASSAQTALTTTASSGTSSLEAFMESLHTLQIGVTATYRF